MNATPLVTEMLVALGLMKLPHEHEYEEIGTQSIINQPLMGIREESTLVLHRCKTCGDKFIQVLTGSWTVDEVRGIKK